MNYTGQCYFKVKKFEKSLKCYDRAIDLNGTDFKAFLYKGDCLFELKKYDEASLCYHKSYGIEPKSYLVLNAIGNIS